MAKKRKRSPQKKSAPRRAKRRAPAKATRRRRYKRNPDGGIQMVLAALAAGIVIPKVMKMIPGPALAKNGGVAAIGAYLAASKFGKKNSLIRGAGIGMAVGSGKALITNFAPALAEDLTPDESVALKAFLMDGVSEDDFIGDPQAASESLSAAIEYGGSVGDPLAIGEDDYYDDDDDDYYDGMGTSLEFNGVDEMSNISV